MAQPITPPPTITTSVVVSITRYFYSRGSGSALPDVNNNGPARCKQHGSALPDANSGISQLTRDGTPEPHLLTVWHHQSQNAVHPQPQPDLQAIPMPLAVPAHPRSTVRLSDKRATVLVD